MGALAAGEQPAAHPDGTLYRRRVAPLFRPARLPARPARRPHGALGGTRGGPIGDVRHVPAAADAALRAAPEPDRQRLYHADRPQHQRDDAVHGRARFQLLRRAVTRDHRRRLALHLAGAGLPDHAFANRALLHHSQRGGRGDGAAFAIALQPRLPARHRGRRRNRADRPLPLAARAGAQPGAAGGNKSVAGGGARAAQSARQLQVAALRQHHARVQDASGHGVGAARADPAGRDG